MLPDGLKLNASNGDISGTPTFGGTYETHAIGRIQCCIPFLA